MLGLFESDIFSASLENMRVIELVIFIVALFILRKFKASAISIILGSGVIGTFLYFTFGII